MSNSLGAEAYALRIAERRKALGVELEGILPARPEDRSLDGPVVLEVGSGHGHFLTAYAAAHPASTCLGVDIELERVERADRKRERAALPNLHFLRGDAADLLPVLPAGCLLSTVFVLFPDPWPKRRHHKNRLMNAGFLRTLGGRAAPGCRLCFRTDFKPYFDSVTALLEGRPDPDATDRGGAPALPPERVPWGILPQVAWPFEYETVFQARASQHYSFVAEPLL